MTVDGRSSDRNGFANHDLHTSVAPPAPTANWSTVRNGKITRIQVVFDARPLAPPGGAWLGGA